MGNMVPRDRSATWIPENIFAKQADGQQTFIRFFTNLRVYCYEMKMWT